MNDDDVRGEALARHFELLLGLITAGRDLTPQDRFNFALDHWMKPIERNAASLLVWLEAEKELSGDTILFFATHLRNTLDRIADQLDTVATKALQPPDHPT